MIFQNYHRHSSYTNPHIADSVVSNEDYAKRASELGHGIISSCEHGFQGRYIESYELAKKYGLKFVFAVEAYWVKDRYEKDLSNCHIFLAARNENGRQAINDVLSEANITGFYRQPRLDIELLLSLPPKDVIVTTACVAYWKYEDIDAITLRFRDHFKENCYLEVQYHNTPKQSAINEHILKLSDAHGIPLIMGCDSHFIEPSDKQERDDYLISKGITYEDEEGWFMDYPDGETAYRRFAKQCVLEHCQIEEAIRNTNVFLEVEEYDNPCFTTDIKMPTLYPDLTQEEKDKIYTNLVWERWESTKHEVPQEKWGLYVDEIQKEIDIVITTRHADYFLIDEAIVRRGKEKGGVITTTGRGSGVSFYTNKLLGFTDIDRISASVKMYPERFMSPTRILESKSLADLDLNLGTPSVFAEAQQEIFGEKHSFPMLAYGTLKPKAAWRMYAKSQNIAFALASEISAQIAKYEKALKHAEEDERDNIDVLDYIDKGYHDIYKQSEKYLGIISDYKIHPCSYLLYQGDIRKEIGLIKIKDNLCCLMDGKWAEDYKFLKNDLLKASVVELIDKVYKRIGIPRHSVSQLLELCPPDDRVWDIYKNGCVKGINQVEQPSTRVRVMKYQPKNISELCAFIAAIRPGFKSMYKIFESRQSFSYGIKSFDELIQTPEMPNTFVLYQEMSMTTLNYAGIPMSECYDIIKNISKKRIEKVLAYKEQFLEGFSQAIIDKENKSEKEADSIAHMIWQILEDSSQYAFNASHSYSVAIDSLYGAYLKTYYPLQFYEVFLNMCEENGEKDRFNQAKKEAEDYFKIKFPSFRFRQDNRQLSADLEKNAINNSLASLKGFGGNVGKALYELKDKQYNSFIDLLLDIKATPINNSQIESLIKIDYFQEFGNSKELLRIKDLFDGLKKGDAKQIAKDKITGDVIDLIQPYVDGNRKDGTPAKSYKVLDMDGLLSAFEEYIRSLNITDFDYRNKMQNQIDILGYIDIVTNQPEDRRKLVAMDVVPLKNKETSETWGWAIFTKSIGTGKTGRLTVQDGVYRKSPISKSDIIYAKEVSKNKRGYWDLLEYERIE